MVGEFKEIEESEPKINPDESVVEKKAYRIKIVADVNEDTLKEVHKIEEESFPEKMQSSSEDLQGILENKEGIHLLVEDDKGKVMGNVLSLRQSEEYADLYPYDADFTKDENALYVESIAIKPESRNVELFNALLKTLTKVAKDRNYKKITMHARTSNGLSAVLQRRYHAKFLRRIENWHDFGEPFDYLEIAIPEDEVKT